MSEWTDRGWLWQVIWSIRYLTMQWVYWRLLMLNELIWAMRYLTMQSLLYANLFSCFRMASSNNKISIGGERLGGTNDFPRDKLLKLDRWLGSASPWDPPRTGTGTQSQPSVLSCQWTQEKVTDKVILIRIGMNNEQWTIRRFFPKKVAYNFAHPLPGKGNIKNKILLKILNL